LRKSVPVNVLAVSLGASSLNSIQGRGGERAALFASDRQHREEAMLELLSRGDCPHKSRLLLAALALADVTIALVVLVEITARAAFPLAQTAETRAAKLMNLSFSLLARWFVG
jgi:hypothetical protein